MFKNLKKMKKIWLLPVCILLATMVGSGQERVVEPEFIGEALVLNSDNSTTKLEKTTVQITTKASAGMYIVGMGKTRTRIFVDGSNAETVLNGNDDIRLIVKAVDNEADPLSIVGIFAFKVSKKGRTAELSSL